jgi:hypothetical protein
MGERKIEFERAVKLLRKKEQLAACLARRDYHSIRHSPWFTGWFVPEWLDLLIDFAEYEWHRCPSQKAHAIVRDFFRLDDEGLIFLKDHYLEIKRAGGYACPPNEEQVRFLAKLSLFRCSRSAH